MHTVYSNFAAYDLTMANEKMVLMQPSICSLHRCHEMYINLFYTTIINMSMGPDSNVNIYNVEQNHYLGCRMWDQHTVTTSRVPQFYTSSQMGRDVIACIRHELQVIHGVKINKDITITS